MESINKMVPTLFEQQLLFAKLYMDHYKDLCRYAQSIVKDKPEAEDITIDVLYRVYKKQVNFRQIKITPAYLTLAVKNACLNHQRFRMRKRRLMNELYYLWEKENTFEIGTDNAPALLKEIHTQVELLPNQCRKIFKLVVCEQNSIADVAAQLKIEKQTVRNQKNKAAAIIRNKLNTNKIMRLVYN